MAIEIKNQKVVAPEKLQTSTGPAQELSAATLNGTDLLRHGPVDTSRTVSSLGNSTSGDDLNTWATPFANPVRYSTPLIASKDLMGKIQAAIQSGDNLTFVLHPTVMDRNGITAAAKLTGNISSPTIGPKCMEVVVGKVSSATIENVDGVPLVRIRFESLNENLAHRYAKSLSNASHFAHEHQGAKNFTEYKAANADRRELVLIDGESKYARVANFVTEPTPQANTILTRTSHLGAVSLFRGAPLMLN